MHRNGLKILRYYQKFEHLCGSFLESKPSNSLESWSLQSPEMLVIILEYTNKKITDPSANYGYKSTFVDHISEAELKAFLGVIYLSGLFKSHHEDAGSLFLIGCIGRPIC